MFSKISVLLSLLVFCLFLQAAYSASSLFHFCFSRENYTAPGPYDTNLDQLFDLLSTKVQDQPPPGFGLSSVGQGEYQVNGLALCRGDVSATKCKSCVIEASNELRQSCPRKKGAIVWYDYCLLKYSGEHFFGITDNVNKFYLYNGYKANDPPTFNGKVNKLLSCVACKASAAAKLYATEELKLEESKTLYGLAQCTQDLSGPGCKKCLDDAISELPNCCDGQLGIRAFGGSCYVRYELYPFVESS